MRLLVASFIYRIVISIVLFALPSLLCAQSNTNPDSMSKNTFTWTQQEREFGFAHFDQLFPTRDVPGGKKVHALTQGKAINILVKTGNKKKCLKHLWWSKR